MMIQNTNINTHVPKKEKEAYQFIIYPTGAQKKLRENMKYLNRKD